MPGLAFVVSAVVIVVVRIRRRRRRKDLHKIPLAPGTLPIVGNLGVVKVERHLLVCFLAFSLSSVIQVINYHESARARSSSALLVP